jgi:hypothetical protein
MGRALNSNKDRGSRQQQATMAMIKPQQAALERFVGRWLEGLKRQSTSENSINQASVATGLVAQKSKSQLTETSLASMTTIQDSTQAAGKIIIKC